MSGGSLNNGQPSSIPERTRIPFGYLILALAQFSGGAYVPASSAALRANHINDFGPLRDAKITDPVVKVKQTAIGDAGECMRPIRKGEWSVEIAALIDEGGYSANGLSDGFSAIGDFRFGSLQHQIVDFIIMKDAAHAICQGVGVFEGGMTLPLAEGGSVIRNVAISRRFGQSYGNLKWANIVTGVLP